MNKLICITVLVFLFTLQGCKENEPITISSPDGNIRLEVLLEEGKLYYKVNLKNDPLIGKSLLGFELKEGASYNNFRIETIEESSFCESWEQVWGEEITVENTYNQLKV